jgi:hypothetical protein
MRILLLDNRMRALVILIGVFLTGVFIAPAFAQEASESAENAKKFNITFPVAELGNCTSVEDCKAYCNEVANQQVCMEFAKKKGLKRKEQKGLNKELLEKAKSLLGCTSEQSCKEFCQQEANFEKCSLFAKENRLRGGIKNASASAALRREIREGLEGTKSGVPGPRSDKAYENANENARFCREYPEKCANASGSGELKESFMKKVEQDKKKLEVKIEKEKKVIELNGERLKKEFERDAERKKKEMEKELEKVENEVEDEVEKAEVQGVSTSPSVFEQIYRFFFK